MYRDEQGGPVSHRINMVPIKYQFTWAFWRKYINIEASKDLVLKSLNSIKKKKNKNKMTLKVVPHLKYLGICYQISKDISSMSFIVREKLV